MERKYAVVTGAGRGIGAAIAKKLAEEGYDILINYAHSKEKAEAVAKEIIEKYNVKAAIFQADVSSYEDMQAMRDFAVDTFGEQAAILINNAGYSNWAPFLEMKPEQYIQCINTDLLGAMHGIHLFAPLMVKNKFGRIINISSTAGLRGTPNMVDYAAAKGGMNALARVITLELGQYNIYANSVCPGYVITDGTADKGTELLDNISNQSPMKRVSTAEEIAEVVAFLIKNPVMGGQVVAPNYGIVLM